MTTPTLDSKARKRLVRRHLILGWGSLVVFVLLGVALETMHAYKVPGYLDADQETRRLMFRLAHAHGALLALLQVALSWTFTQLPERTETSAAGFLSWTSTGALVLLPVGFFVAGLSAEGGDPGIGIVLVPVGAVFLLLSLIRTVMVLSKAED